MGTQFSSSNPEYNSAASNWQRAYDQTSAAIDKYRGNLGYQNSLGQGAMGANFASQGAARKASSMANTAGLTKSAAAARGAEAASQGYYDAFNNQQQIASDFGNKYVDARMESMQALNNRMNQALQHKDQTYNMAWGNLANGLGIAGSFISAMSDSTLKNYYKISEKYKKER